MSMHSYYSELFHEYHSFYKTADPRVADWLFVSSPTPTLTIVCFYILIVCFAGRWYMNERNPVDFGMFLPIYNFSIALFNFYIADLSISGSFNAGYSLTCTPLNRHSTDLNEMKVARATWWFYISKHVELLDTFIIIMRKRYHQISFLHVYHHASMPVLWWMGTKWFPSGQSFFSVSLNSSVHVVMYTYYGLSAMGPKVQKHLWWKKGLTLVQQVQFCCFLIHALISFYVDCSDYPKWLHILFFSYTLSILLLFANFYLKTYVALQSAKLKKN